MKALSVRQPWAWFILRAGKRIENRTWQTTHRGPVLLHASKGMTRAEYAAGVEDAAVDTGEDYEAVIPGPKELKRGGIVGVMDIVGCRPNPRSLSDLEPWEGDEGFAWTIGGVMPLPFIECSGSLGLWDVPEDIIELAGLRALCGGSVDGWSRAPMDLHLGVRIETFAPLLVESRPGIFLYEWRLTQFGQRVADQVRT